MAADQMDVCEFAALVDGQTVKYITDDYPILVVRDGARVRAFRAFCTHQGMEIMASGIRGSRVTCSRHGWQFEMPDGRCLFGEKWSLKELPARVLGGRVIVEWPADD